MGGLKLEYLRNEMKICLIMNIFAFMMIYLIEFNQLIKIDISCGSLYQMNWMKMNLNVKQQIYTMTRSKIRIGLRPNIKPSILFKERDKKRLIMGRNIWWIQVNDSRPAPKTTQWGIRFSFQLFLAHQWKINKINLCTGWY